MPEIPETVRFHFARLAPSPWNWYTKSDFKGCALRWSAPAGNVALYTVFRCNESLSSDCCEQLLDGVYDDVVERIDIFKPITHWSMIRFTIGIDTSFWQSSITTILSGSRMSKVSNSPDLSRENHGRTGPIRMATRQNARIRADSIMRRSESGHFAVLRGNIRTCIQTSSAMI